MAPRGPAIRFICITQDCKHGGLHMMAMYYRAPFVSLFQRGSNKVCQSHFLLACPALMPYTCLMLLLMKGLGFWLLCRELDIVVVVGFPLHFNEFSPDSFEWTQMYLFEGREIEVGTIFL